MRTLVTAIPVVFALGCEETVVPSEFGDSTLTFELRYWLDISQANAAQVSSDLRLMIAGSFAEHGIVVDFPQRDIHLHAARPIQVEMVSPAEAPRGNDAKANQTEVATKPSVLP